jgi:hypothetical protein
MPACDARVPTQFSPWATKRRGGWYRANTVMAAKLDVSVVVVGAPEDVSAMKMVAERLGKEGLGGRMELIPGTEVERMGQIVDSYPGRTLFIALESVAFPKPLVRRLEGVFGARRGPDQRLFAVVLDPRVPLSVMPPIRAAVAEYALPGASAALSRTGSASISRREVVSPAAVARARSGPQARASAASEPSASPVRADLSATARFVDGSTSLEATGEFAPPPSTPRADLASTRRLGPSEPAPTSASASPGGTSLTASQQLIATRRLAMSEESNPWADETKPLTASTRLARTPPGIDLDSTVAEKTKSGGRTSSRRLAVDEAEKFVETQRRSWRVFVLGGVALTAIAAVAVAFVSTGGFGTMSNADEDAEAAARSKPRTSALDDAASEPSGPTPKVMKTQLQPAPLAEAPTPSPSPTPDAGAPPAGTAPENIRTAPPAPTPNGDAGTQAEDPSNTTSAATPNAAAGTTADSALDPEVLAAAIEAGDIRVLDLMLVAPVLAATNFDVAVSLCRTRDVRGITGFRLPTIKELQRLRKARMIRGSHTYWSGDPAKSGERAVLEDGVTRRVESTTQAKVVCVRNQ